MWVDLSYDLMPFNPRLRTPRGKKAQRINHLEDDGGLNVPKIFRRQVDYEVRKRAKVTDRRSLSDYIRTKKKDTCYARDDFFANGTKAKLRHVSEFVDTNGKIQFEPDQLIFKEDVSAVLKDSNGGKITKWE